MEHQSRIAKLSSIIAAQTAVLDQFFAAHPSKELSFAEDGAVDMHLPPHIEQARQLSIEASTELTDLLKGPRDILFDHHVEHVPKGGEISFRELALSAGVDESSATRILRMAIANRIFQEPKPGFLAHTAASRILVDDANMRDWLGASVDEMWPSAFYLVDALAKWPAAAEPNETGFSLSQQSSESFYAELDRNPERARRFGGAMSFFTSGDGYSMSHVTDNFPWQSASIVVDLGGSLGESGFAIAKKFPGVEVIVQDLPETVAAAKEKPGLNVRFVAHDFFLQQPNVDADVYFLRWILHNWSDEYAVKILKALIPALKPGAKLLLMDMVMPPPNVLPNGIERKLRAMDVTMLEIASAKERDLDEWRALFAAADSRFEFEGVKQPEGSRLALIEYSWKC